MNTPTTNPTEPSPLPPYTGPDVRCPKCWHTGASTLFLKLGTCLHGREAATIGAKPNPRLHRECDRCEYQWDEAPADDDQAATPDSPSVHFYDLARALEASASGWALDLSPECAEHMALNLLSTFHITPRPDAPTKNGHQA